MSLMEETHIDKQDEEETVKNDLEMLARIIIFMYIKEHCSDPKEAKYQMDRIFPPGI
jgi:hypothetical protein